MRIRKKLGRSRSTISRDRPRDVYEWSISQSVCPRENPLSTLSQTLSREPRKQRPRLAISLKFDSTTSGFKRFWRFVYTPRMVPHSPCSSQSCFNLSNPSFFSTRVPFSRSIDRSSFRPSIKVIEGNRSLVLQLGKYIPCDLYRETCGKVSRYSKICSPLPTTAATIVIFYTFCESENIFIPSSLSTGVNEQNAQRRFLFFLFIYIFNARVAIPSKGYKVFLNRVPRLFFAKKKK